MPFLNSVIDFIVKVFWPWFIKHAWPIIQDSVMDILKTVLAELTEKLKKIFSDHGQQNAAEADANAAHADAKAEAASSAAEKEKWEAIAAVWRDAAHMFREENEQLKKQLEEAMINAEKATEERIQNINLSMRSTHGTPVLTLGDRSTALPLPEESISKEE